MAKFPEILNVQEPNACKEVRFSIGERMFTLGPCFISGGVVWREFYKNGYCGDILSTLPPGTSVEHMPAVWVAYCSGRNDGEISGKRGVQIAVKKALSLEGWN